MRADQHASSSEGFDFDATSGVLRVHGREAVLRPKAASVLRHLLAHEGRVVAKRELFETAWPGVVVTDDSLVQCVHELRAAFGTDAPLSIRTVSRRGYRLERRALPPRPRIRAMRKEVTFAAAALAVVAVTAWWAIGERGGKRLEGRDASIIVLPFSDLSRNGTQGYLAEAVADELTGDLGRMPSATVVARGTARTYAGAPVDLRRLRTDLGVRYAVEGTVDQTPQWVRVNVRLLETESGVVAWSERFEEPPEHLAEMAGDIAARTARALYLRLPDFESRRARRERPANPDAYDLTMRGWSSWNRQTREANAEARRDFLAAIERDDRIAYAWIGLASTYLSDIEWRWAAGGAERDDRLRRADEAIARAHAIDRWHPALNGALGAVRVLQGRLDEGLAAFDTQISRNRSHAPAHLWRGRTLLYLGRPQESIESFRTAIRLSPRDERMPTLLVGLAGGCLMAGDAAQALIHAREALALRPDHPMALALLASAAATSGDQREARGAIERLRSAVPDQSIQRLRAEDPGLRAGPNPAREQFYSGLRLAGLPER